MAIEGVIAASLHDQIIELGSERARRELDLPAATIEAAIHVLENEEDKIGLTYSGFALTSFPHRRTACDQPWERRNNSLVFRVTPGEMPNASGGVDPVGVPFGAMARIIMIYLQTEAVKNNSPSIYTGRSMKDWMKRMNINVGGKTYKNIKEQVARIYSCNISFRWTIGDHITMVRDTIIRGGVFHLEQDDQQSSLWSEMLHLSDTFFQELKNHAVPLSEHSIAQILNNSMSIDIYIWLAYRLHSLQRPTRLSWHAVYDQFGTGFRSIHDFKKKFPNALQLALAVYPEARVDMEKNGFVLHPSHPPISKRIHSTGAQDSRKILVPGATT
jgi:hypothetical protein